MSIVSGSSSFEAVSFLQYDELIQKLRDNPEQNWVDISIYGIELAVLVDMCLCRSRSCILN